MSQKARFPIHTVIFNVTTLYYIQLFGINYLFFYIYLNFKSLDLICYFKTIAEFLQSVCTRCHPESFLLLIYSHENYTYCIINSYD